MRTHYHKRKKTLNKLISKIVGITAILILVFGGYLLISGQLSKMAESAKIAAEKAAAEAKEAKRKKPVYITLPGASRIRAITEDYSVTGSIWMLVNKSRSISADYTPTVSIPNISTNPAKSDNEKSIRTDIIPEMTNMFNAASDNGYALMIGSGYRPYSLQAYLFNSLADSVGEEVANQSVAKPGQSEHQTGLAVDISPSSKLCYIADCFANTDEGRWLANNSYKYGFILRYPSDKVSVTGYQYEPWHFRYVGIDLATALHQSGLTLEEAWTYLQTALSTLRANGAIGR